MNRLHRWRRFFCLEKVFFCLSCVSEIVKIIPMNKGLLTALMMAAGVMLSGNARADWSSGLGDLWDEAGEVGKEWGEKGKEWGKDAWEKGKEEWNKAKERWDNLDLNYELMQAFGGDVDENSALIGRFYDLKQPIREGAKALSRNEVVAKIREFDEKKWDLRVLEDYYSPAVRLYAPYFYLPRCKASYGPEAFQCNVPEEGRRVQPCAWVVVYRGVVTAPESGHFRFVGMGDDTLMVRFNNKLVLEGGWSVPSRSTDMNQGTYRSYQQEMINNKNKRAYYQYKQTPHWNRVIGGIPAGQVFKVKKGEKYPIEILVSEIPGSEFGFCLLVEKVKSPGRPPRGIIPADKSPELALFRTNETKPDFSAIERALTAGDKDFRVKGFMEGPPFKEDSPVWKVDYDEAQEQGLFDSVFGLFRDDDTAMGKRK